MYVLRHVVLYMYMIDTLYRGHYFIYRVGGWKTQQ